MRIQILAPAALIAIIACTMLFAADKNKDSRQALQNSTVVNMDRPHMEAKVHNIGTLWNTVTNFGSYGEADQATPSMEWPAGSGCHYLWIGGLWIGATVGIDTFVSHAEYGNYEWLPSEGSTFEFGAGKSTLDSYVKYDDLDEMAGHNPLGIKVHQRGLSWNANDFDDFIAYEYEIINVGNQVLDNAYVGWIYDCDVGAGIDASNPHMDDLVDFDGWHSSEYSDWHGVSPNLITTDGEYVDIVENIDKNGNGLLDGYDEYGVPFGDPYSPRYDPSKINPDGYPDEWQVFVRENGDTLLIPRNMSYMYDSDDPETPEEDTGELGATPTDVTGYIGGRLIYAPITLYNETQDDTLLRPFAHQWWDHDSDPGGDREKFWFLAGIHPIFSGMKFLRNPLDIESPVFDYRFFTSTGPYNNFIPGDTLRIVYVAAVGKGLRDLRKNMDNAMIAYYSGSHLSDPANPSDPVADRHWEITGPPIVRDASANPSYVVPGQDPVIISAKVYDIDASVGEVHSEIKLEDGTLVDTLPLYDDGSHNDGAPGDSIFANVWPVSSTDEVIYRVDIYAADSEGDGVTRENVTRFTTIGPIVFEKFVFVGDDTIPSPYEDIYFRIELSNAGSQGVAENIEAKLTTQDEFIRYIWINNTKFEQGIPPGESRLCSYDLMLRSTDDCPDGHTANFNLEISSGGTVFWHDTFTLTFVDDKAPLLMAPHVDRHVSPGDPVTISIRLVDGAGVKQVRADIQSPDDSTIASLELINTHDDVFAAEWITPSDKAAAYDIDLFKKDNLDNEATEFNLMGFTTKTFSVQNNILLVDDDHYNHPNNSPYKKSYESYYVEALNSCGLSYDLYSVYFYGTPDSSLLDAYSGGFVIWETGDTKRDQSYWEKWSFTDERSLSEEEILNLEIFLSNGGRLFISGQGIGYDTRTIRSNLFIDYFGVSVIDRDFEKRVITWYPNDPVSNRIRFRIEGGTGADNQTGTTILSSNNDFTFPIFRYGTDEAAAVRVDNGTSRLIYLGFGFEAIDKESSRIQLMQRIVDWMLEGVGVEQQANNESLPKKFALHQNFPNPFNPITNIQFDLPQNSQVQIEVVNLLGQTVATLVDETRKAGSHTINWHATDFTSGIYLLRMQAGDYLHSQKMLLVR